MNVFKKSLQEVTFTGKGFRFDKDLTKIWQRFDKDLKKGTFTGNGERKRIDKYLKKIWQNLG